MSSVATQIYHSHLTPPTISQFRAWQRLYLDLCVWELLKHGGDGRMPLDLALLSRFPLGSKLVDRAFPRCAAEGYDPGYASPEVEFLTQLVGELLWSGGE